MQPRKFILADWFFLSRQIFSQSIWWYSDTDIEAGVQATVQHIQEQQDADQEENDDGNGEDTDDDEDTSDQLVQFM